MVASGSCSWGKSPLRDYPPQDHHTIRARSVLGSDGPISLTHDNQSHLFQRVREGKVSFILLSLFSQQFELSIILIRKTVAL